MKSFIPLASCAAALVIAGGGSARAATPVATVLISVSSSGAQARCGDPWGCSGPASMSTDGRFVAFVSSAGNLVAGDTNHVSDVFVHDCLTDRATRVGVGRGGRPGNGASGSAAISADGRFVAFASNLAPGDTNATVAAFLRGIGPW